MTTQVTGVDDDLVTVCGDIQTRFGATRNFYGGAGLLLGFSDGTILDSQYKNGIWRFDPVVKGTLFENVVQGSVEEDTFDVANFKDGLKWVAISRKDTFAKARN